MPVSKKMAFSPSSTPSFDFHYSQNEIVHKNTDSVLTRIKIKNGLFTCGLLKSASSQNGNGNS